MKQNVTFSAFCNAFSNAFSNTGRGSDFSYDGLRILFDYLEEIEAGNFDVVEIDGAYAEGTPEDIASDYGIELDEDDTADMDDDEKAEALEAAVLDYLNRYSVVCGQTDAGTIVYCSAF